MYFLYINILATYTLILQKKTKKTKKTEKNFSVPIRDMFRSTFNFFPHTITILQRIQNTKFTKKRQKKFFFTILFSTFNF